MTFELYRRDSGNQKFTVTGPYSITDGGYHRWRSCQFPFKFCAERTARGRWSKRLESVRKDTECCFGRSLKGRCRKGAACSRTRFA